MIGPKIPTIKLLPASLNIIHVTAQMFGLPIYFSAKILSAQQFNRKYYPSKSCNRSDRYKIMNKSDHVWPRSGLARPPSYISQLVIGQKVRHLLAYISTIGKNRGILQLSHQPRQLATDS